MTARSDNSEVIPIAKTSALLNEIKGNIFEFAVAREWARQLQLEEQFLTDFGEAGLAWLTPYETYLRTHHRELLPVLLSLGRTLAGHLEAKVQAEFKGQRISALEVVGKRVSGSAERGRDEADVRLHFEAHPSLMVSLKLAKAHSFVNTKSGGIKSFLAEYLGSAREAERIQAQLNHEVDHSFDQMGADLYESLGLWWQGTFDGSWPLSRLPGELSPELRARVTSTYAHMAKFLHQIFSELLQDQPADLHALILRLMGFSRPDLIQAICFYTPENGGYNFSSVEVATFQEMQQELAHIELLPHKKGLSSFELRIGKKRLQIRIKPMNVFTTASFKINCSVKHD